MERCGLVKVLAVGNHVVVGCEIDEGMELGSVGTRSDIRGGLEEGLGAADVDG